MLTEITCSNKEALPKLSIQNNTEHWLLVLECYGLLIGDTLELKAKFKAVTEEEALNGWKWCG